jgi:hypothetical protein
VPLRGEPWSFYRLRREKRDADVYRLRREEGDAMSFLSKLGREKKYLELFGSLIESSYLCHRIIKD